MLLVTLEAVFWQELNATVPIPEPSAEAEPQTLESTDQSYTIIVGGDVMLDRTIDDAYLAFGFDPFAGVRDLLAGADLAVANLECVVSDQGFATAGKLYTFRADPRVLSLLASSGIDLVSVANNHSGDYGVGAFTDMLQRLSQAGVDYLGGGANATEAYAPKYVQLGQMKLALIAFNMIETPYFTATDNGPGHAWADEELLRPRLVGAASEADLVIVMPHWGMEYTASLHPDQTRLAHLLIDWGADLVVGSHPHHIQTSENYNGGSIYYSLGNFIFDGGGPNAGWSEGELLQITVSQDAGVASVKTVQFGIATSGLATLH